MNSDIGWTDEGMLRQLHVQRASEQAHREREQRAAAVHLCDTALRLADGPGQAREWAADVLGAIGAIDLSDVPLECGHPRSRRDPRLNRCQDCWNDHMRQLRAEREAS